MIDAGNKDYDNAVHTANQASRVVQSFERDIAHYSSKVSQYSDNITDLSGKITQLYGEIQSVDREISDIKEQHSMISVIQVKMRSAVTLLGSLAKSANAAEFETKHMIVLASLIQILHHVFTLSAKMLGHQFYNDTELKTLFSTLQINEQKLQALANANKNNVLNHFS